MLKIKSLFTIVVIFSIMSCSKYPAPIVDNSDFIYKKAYPYKYTQKYDSKKYDKPQTSKKYVIVEAGDSIYSISKQYNVAMKDIIDENGLSAPFILPVGKKITLPTANFHVVKKGESLYSVSRLYGVSINEIAAKNSLSEPYQINEGQKLAIGTSVASNEASDEPYRYKPEPKTVSHARSISKAGFSWPLKGEVITAFGPRSGGLYNDGINIRAKSGDIVRSSQDGVVAYVGDELKGYGNLIIIKHDNEMITAYGHLQEAKVKRGDKVEQGQTIAYAGSSGNVNSVQLYFGLRKGRDAINPQIYLKN